MKRKLTRSEKATLARKKGKSPWGDQMRSMVTGTPGKRLTDKEVWDNIGKKYGG